MLFTQFDTKSVLEGKGKGETVVRELLPKRRQCGRGTALTESGKKFVVCFFILSRFAIFPFPRELNTVLLVDGFVFVGFDSSLLRGSVLFWVGWGFCEVLREARKRNHQSSSIRENTKRAVIRVCRLDLAMNSCAERGL